MLFNDKKISKGYQNLKQSSQLDQIMFLKGELTEVKFNSLMIDRSKNIPKNKNFEISLRQFLIFHLLNNKFHKSLLTYFADKESSSLRHPLPRVWQRYLKTKGIKVNAFVCNFLFSAFILKHLTYGLIEFWARFLAILMNLFNNKKSLKNKYIFFDTLTFNNLPHSLSNSYDVISWFYSKKFFQEDINIVHSVKNYKPIKELPFKLIYKKNYFPIYNSFSQFLKFFSHSLLSLVHAIKSIFLGRWWSALFLREIIKYHVFDFSENQSLAREYYFHNSGWIYRPFWTYAAEKKGCKINFYFYSYNNMNFSSKNHERIINYGITSMSWPNYYVWDKQHADWVRKYVKHEKNIYTVGPIWFHDSQEKEPINNIMFAVFDIPPFINSISNTFGLDMELHHPDAAKTFLKDICEIATKNDLQVHIKSKRFNKNTDPSYLSLILELEDNKNVFIIDSNTAAEKIIANSAATINYPFTSTGIISNTLKKPTIYYDPTDFFHQNAVESVQCIGSKLELESWMLQFKN